jgi:hypothetical protein
MIPNLVKCDYVKYICGCQNGDPLLYGVTAAPTWTVALPMRTPARRRQALAGTLDLPLLAVSVSFLKLMGLL